MAKEKTLALYQELMFPRLLKYLWNISYVTCILPHFEVHLPSSYHLNHKADLNSIF